MTAKIIQFKQKYYKCSFCGKPRTKELRMVKSDTGATICEECLAKCRKLANES